MRAGCDGVDELDIRTCPMVGFGVNVVESSGSTTREWASYMAMNYKRRDAYDS
jgi:hypothetical protein